MVTDAQTNSISIFNLLEEITAIGVPFLIPKLSFFILLRREELEPNESTCTLIIRNNDSELIRHSIQINFQRKLNNRLIATFGGLLINATGNVSVTLVDAENAQLGTWRIGINAPQGAVQPISTAFSI